MVTPTDEIQIRTTERGAQQTSRRLDGVRNSLNGVARASRATLLPFAGGNLLAAAFGGSLLGLALSGGGAANSMIRLRSTLDALLDPLLPLIDAAVEWFAGLEQWQKYAILAAGATVLLSGKIIALGKGIANAVRGVRGLGRGLAGLRFPTALGRGIATLTAGLRNATVAANAARAAVGAGTAAGAAADATRGVTGAGTAAGAAADAARGVTGAGTAAGAAADAAGQAAQATARGSGILSGLRGWLRALTITPSGPLDLLDAGLIPVDYNDILTSRGFDDLFTIQSENFARLGRDIIGIPTAIDNAVADLEPTLGVADALNAVRQSDVTNSINQAFAEIGQRNPLNPFSAPWRGSNPSPAPPLTQTPQVTQYFGLDADAARQAATDVNADTAMRWREQGGF